VPHVATQVLARSKLLCDDIEAEIHGLTAELRCAASLVSNMAATASKLHDQFGSQLMTWRLSAMSRPSRIKPHVAITRIAP
jgi:hypothetical protein